MPSLAGQEAGRRQGQLLRTRRSRSILQHCPQRYLMMSSPSPPGAIVSSFIVLAQTMQDMSVTSGLWSSFIVRPTACGTVRSCLAVHDALASETRRRERRARLMHPLVRIDLPRSQKNSLTAGYALRPSYFWMPQVGYDIRCYAIIFRCPALFNFAHCPNFKCRVSERKRPQLGGATWGTRAGAVVSWGRNRRKCVRHTQ
jgi:hypothetical protein